MAAQDVIKLLKTRDEKGPEELLKHFGPLLRYVIAPFLSDPRDREEVLQDCVMKVWQSFQLTFSTGRLSPCQLLGLVPITAFHRA